MQSRVDAEQKLQQLRKPIFDSNSGIVIAKAILENIEKVHLPYGDVNGGNETLVVGGANGGRGRAVGGLMAAGRCQQQQKTRQLAWRKWQCVTISVGCVECGCMEGYNKVFLHGGSIGWVA